MGLLRNKRGVEGLPLRYIIIALVAALVIGIALQFVGVLRGGTISTAEKINDTLTEKTTCELDEEAPAIDFTIDSINNETAGELVFSVNITDDCGVDVVIAYLDGPNDESIELVLKAGDAKSGTWEGTIDSLDDGMYDIRVWAKDKATAANDNSVLLKDIEVI